MVPYLAFFVVVVVALTSYGRKGERVSCFFFLIFYKCINPIHEAPPSRSNPKAPPLNTVTLGHRLQHVNIVRTQIFSLWQFPNYLLFCLLGLDLKYNIKNLPLSIQPSVSSPILSGICSLLVEKLGCKKLGDSGTVIRLCPNRAVLSSSSCSKLPPPFATSSSHS